MTMEPNGEAGGRMRKFSEGKAKSMSMSPENVKDNDLDSSANSDTLNPSPPVKVPPRSITDVESRLLNLAKEKPSYRRRRDSSSDNDDRRKRKTKSPDRRASRSPPPRRRSRTPKRSRSRDRVKSRTPPRRRSRTPKRRTRSPERKKHSPEKRKYSPEKRKYSPDRRARSPAKRKTRSPDRKSYSPKRKGRSRSPRSKSRRSPSRTPPRRKGRSSRSRSNDRRRRSRSRSIERRRRSRSRSRSRGKGRSRSRSNERTRSKSRRHSRSRSSSPMFTSKWGQRPAGICRAVLPASTDDKRSREVTTEDVEKRLAQHMQSVQQKAAEEAKKINLPGYLNPAMVNVHQFKQVQDKRKLLWSKAKDKKDTASAQWSGAFEKDQNNDQKFRRLMGIGETAGDSDNSKIQESRKVLDDLEKEYEKSRAFQLSRGAGGLTGIGLGFGSAVQPQ